MTTLNKYLVTATLYRTVTYYVKDVTVRAKTAEEAADMVRQDPEVYAQRSEMDAPGLDGDGDMQVDEQ